jgi:hypothetical protein
VLTPAFQTFALSCGFQVDPCRPATGRDKGKVERQVRTDRTAFADLFVTAWPTLDALPSALDTGAAALHRRRRCPATGTTVAEALHAERQLLQPMPAVYEPFDCVVARRVLPGLPGELRGPALLVWGVSSSRCSASDRQNCGLSSWGKPAASVVQRRHPVVIAHALEHSAVLRRWDRREHGRYDRGNGERLFASSRRRTPL